MNPSSETPRRKRMLTTITDAKQCEGCQVWMTRDPHQSLARWETRRFCSRPCRDARLSERNRERYGQPMPRLTVPDSARRVATWDGVSTRCWKCQTGLWKPIVGGVSCLQCGMDCYVAEALARLG